MTKRYSGPVIDPHHHLWDLSLKRHPWLEKAPLSFSRDYGVGEYLADCVNQNIIATVHVEAGWSDRFPLEETRWLNGLDRTTGIARRYVARVPLDSPDAIQLLEAQAAHPAVVGIRDIVSWHPEPRKSFAKRPYRMADSLWRAGLARLTRLGLVFDLMLFPWQMQEALELVQAFPQTLFVLNHCGSPIDRSEDGMMLWREGLRALGRQPNMRLKISDLVAYDNAWTLESLSAVIEHCLECFGPDRCMFASDFPVAALHASFVEIYEVFRTVAAALSLDEQKALFLSTANETYNVGVVEGPRTRDECHA